MMVIYLASGNPNKVREFRELAESAEQAGGRPQIEIRSASEVGGMPHVVEDTGSFTGNARKKAYALHERLPAGSWALADDSGLCVDALGGAPGVESAYYAGPRASGAENLAKLVAAMRDVPDGRRGAYYICVLFLFGLDGTEHVFEGRCSGHLVHDPSGSGGFGYDPLFIPDGYENTFAELEADLKNRLSHRGRAWAKLMEWADKPGKVRAES